jgi:hypothetical protein|tara:strand:+ start:4645 stop:10056 length:5412 start_codon:yes stop_codon:yes gene_type:complete
MPQQPGNWDRFFNSTISWPQQFLWRVQRAIQEDDIDLFSEKGLMDLSMVPLLGILDDHKEDVMPDYMFGEGLGAQIAGSIAYDPLTYMSGGLSALAKGAQIGNRARSMASVSRHLTSKFGKGKGIGGTTLNQLDGALAEILDSGKKLKRGDRRKMHKMRSQIGNLVETGDTARRFETPGTKRLLDRKVEGIGDMSFDTLLKSEGEKQLAWRLPILWRAGAEINVAPQYRNWFNFWGKKGEQVSDFVKAKTVTHLGPISGEIAKLPFAQEAAERFGTAFKYLNLPGHVGSGLRAWGRGWAVGGDAAYAPFIKFNEKQLSEQSAYLNTKVSQFYERMRNADGGVSKAQTKFQKAVDEGEPDLFRAFVKAYGKPHAKGRYRGKVTVGPKTAEKRAKEIYGQMVGSPNVFEWSDETQESFQALFSGGRNNAVADIGDLANDFMKNSEDAWSSLYGNVAEAKKTRAGKAVAAHGKELDETLKGLGGFKNVMFETAKKSATLTTKAFTGDSGLRDLLAAEKVLRQHENMGADQARAVGELLYSMVKPAAKEANMDWKDYLKSMGNMFEGVTNPDELIMSFAHPNMTGEDYAKSLDAVGRFLHRHLTAIEAVGGMAQKGSLSRNSLRGLQATLKDEMLSQIPKDGQAFMAEVHRVVTATEGTGQSARRVLPDKMLANPLNMHKVDTGLAPTGAAERRMEIGLLNNRELEEARRRIANKGMRDWTPEEFADWMKNHRSGKQVAKFKGKFNLTDKELKKAIRTARRQTSRGAAKSRTINGKVIDEDALASLKRQIGDKGMRIVLGDMKRFDEQVLKAAGTKKVNYITDWEKVKQLQAQRSAGVEEMHRAKSVQAKPPDFSVGPGAVEEVIRVGKDNEGVSEWADSFVRAKILQDELSTWVDRTIAKNTELGTQVMDVPQELLDDLMLEVNRMSSQLWDVYYKGQGDTGKELLDLIKHYQSGIAENALKGGIIMPGAPLGYLGRFMKGQERQELDKLMARTDMRNVLNRIGIKMPSYFGRHKQADEMVVDDLNDMYRALNADRTDAGKALAKEVEDIVTRGTGNKEFLKHWEEDPILRTVTRLSHSAQNDTLEKFFEAAMDAGTLVKGKETGQALAVGGRVVGWFDDTGNVNKYEQRQVKVLSEKKKVHRGRGRATASEVVSELAPGVPQRAEFVDKDVVTVGEVVETTEDTLKGIIIKTADGREIAVSSDQLKHGMGVLSLGKVDDYTKTTANAFVKAIHRANVDKTFIRGNFTIDDVRNLEGQHVVFGNESMVAGTVNMTRNLLDVTPHVLRQVDTMNYAIKSWQTVHRLPFHVANFTSGIFQAMYAGASAADVAAGYYHAARMLHKKDAGFLRLHDRTLSAIGKSKVLPGEGLRLGRGEFVAAARRIGSGWLGEVPPEMISKYGLDEVDDFMIPITDGGHTSAGEILRHAAQEGLYGTYAAAGMRGSQTISDTLLRLKTDALDANLIESYGDKDFAGMLRRAAKKSWNAATGRPGPALRSATEAVEVLNRTGTAFALVRAGHSPKRAVQMARAAHVPYEQVTNFEKNWLKRGIMYYTFPRHYVPHAWTKFMEDPKKLSVITNTIRQSTSLDVDGTDVGFTQFEGKPVLKVGDYRVDVGRLNANLESALMFSSFLDNIAMPVLRMAPGVGEPADPRFIHRQMTDMGLMSSGGLGSIIGMERSLLPAYPTRPTSRDPWTAKMLKITWPIKMLAQAAGKLPGSGPLNLLPPDDLDNPKTNIEKALTHTDLGIPFRKVRAKNEIRVAMGNHRRLMADLKARYVSENDPEERELIRENMQSISEALQRLIAREQD